ncbi:hypothetical protein [Streptomyces sp. NPDC006925]|uniref:hypothetical protein n=1 Tax=Streptomyces sp. NPDC006925 TaxID=3364768 RepID=UPI0036BFF2F5
MRAPRGRRAPALLALLALLLAGCSGGREYAVPEKFCGVRMPSEAVEPLLPDGEELHRSLRPLDGTATSCGMNVVDGPSVVDVTVTELDKPLTAADRRVSLKSLEHAKNVRVPGTHWAVQGDRRIHLSAPCGADWADSLSFRFSFTEGEKGAEATRRNTLRFAKAFVRGERKEEVCTAK